MTRLLTAVFVAVAMCAVISCGGRAPAPTKPAPEPPARAGSGSAHATAATSETKVAEADCMAAIDHMIEIDLAERPADQQLSAADVAELRTSLRTSVLPDCLKQPREAVACVTAATTRAAVKACDR